MLQPFGHFPGPKEGKGDGCIMRTCCFDSVTQDFTTIYVLLSKQESTWRLGTYLICMIRAGAKCTV